MSVFDGLTPTPDMLEDWQPFRWGDSSTIGKWLRTLKNDDNPDEGWLYARCNGGKSFKASQMGDSLFVVEYLPDGTKNACRWYSDFGIEVQA